MACNNKENPTNSNSTSISTSAIQEVKSTGLVEYLNKSKGTFLYIVDSEFDLDTIPSIYYVKNGKVTQYQSSGYLEGQDKKVSIGELAGKTNKEVLSLLKENDPMQYEYQNAIAGIENLDSQTDAFAQIQSYKDIIGNQEQFLEFFKYNNSQLDGYLFMDDLGNELEQEKVILKHSVSDEILAENNIDEIESQSGNSGYAGFFSRLMNRAKLLK